MKLFVENELKILITEELYQDIFRQAFQHGAKTMVQTNHYFDTSDFYVTGEKMSLRIREKNNEYMLTLKVGRKKAGQFQSSDEYNKALENEQALSVIHGMQPIESLLNDFPLKNVIRKERALLYKGYMVTKRTSYMPVEGLNPLELDQNVYLGMQDYELEWEYDQQEQYKAILDWLKQQNIHTTSLMTRSKFGRFMERLIALKEHSLP